MNANQVNWDAGQEHQNSNPLLIIHRHLRGRYPLVIVLGLLFGIAGGIAGYVSKEPQYRSTGIIQIKPTLPKVLYESEQSTAPKMFSSLVNSQAKFITYGEVVKLAIESDSVKALEGEIGYQFDVDVVRRKLSARPDQRAQEIIFVSYEDSDPRVSSVIVNAVLDAYIEKYGKAGSIKNPGVIRALVEREQALKGDLGKKKEEINTIVKEHSSDDLSSRIRDTAELIRAREDELERVNSYLANFGVRQAVEVSTSDSGVLAKDETDESDQDGDDAQDKNDSEKADDKAQEKVVGLSAEEAAARDNRMAALVQQLDALIENKTQMMVAEGLREEHRDVRRITSMIDNIQKSIDERLSQLQSSNELVLYDESGNPLPGAGQLSERKEALTRSIQDAQTYMQQLLEDSQDLDRLREERANIQASLMQVEDRRAMINTESKLEDTTEIGGKISIASKALEAKSPTSDPRLKRAGAGFVGAGMLPVFGVLAIGYFSRRVKFSDDEVLTGTNAGIVGMLPDLGSSLDDQELASASAFAVHQIRSQLQIKNTGNATRIYGVTSPAPRDGKTSLIIAMGLSFAESGSRTLLVDLDFIGRGLSVHFGYTEAPSLAESLADSDAITGLVHKTEFPGLDILPAGFGDDMRVSRLSPRTVGALLETLRGRYDTVLIDTGPILGSVEAAFVAPQADGVLLVVGRGQYKPLIKKAIDQINAVDGTIAATIFNRASVHEIRHASSSMSVHFSRQFSRQQQEMEQGNGSKVGPVAGSLFMDRPRNGASSHMRKVER